MIFYISLWIIKKSYNNEIQENESKIISEFINCNVLIIDDLGKENPSEWVLEKLYYIINERYEYNKPIIITTNFTKDQLIDIFTVGKNKSSIEAIMSRLNEICLTIKIFDNDYRYKTWKLKTFVFVVGFYLIPLYNLKRK